ncbi:hypothetical protein NLG42_20070 [Flavobacterium plurextorum]|uniref:hypothetical protein n=1 Tax=Flavobacterium TaxID=237 RepID=UPI00214DBA68|nr:MULTISPECIES: hypothetical protein [Flavobacterium]UUW08394.1 hypothetical protein NLG42_20070 [Flavobacterium plurextorum]
MESERSKIEKLKVRNNFLLMETSSLMEKPETIENQKRIEGNFEEIKINNAIISDLEKK